MTNKVISVQHTPATLAWLERLGRKSFRMARSGQYAGFVVCTGVDASKPPNRSMVDRLEFDGLIHWDYDAEARTFHWVASLTDAGRAVIAKATMLLMAIQLRLA